MSLLSGSLLLGSLDQSIYWLAWLRSVEISVLQLARSAASILAYDEIGFKTCFCCLTSIALSIEFIALFIIVRLEVY
ncbi:protein of unknown function [Shewanella benthica]|uniref:Uncharacterized protein n=1 Tax=Shewanella benthica TaxID=43661 RepID=A0A330M862_9GAMM|nr:protein of unknown function [Shewanella benthica]